MAFSVRQIEFLFLPFTADAGFYGIDPTIQFPCRVVFRNSPDRGPLNSMYGSLSKPRSLPFSHQCRSLRRSGA